MNGLSPPPRGDQPMSPARSGRRVGFAAGLAAVFQGFAFIAATRRTWPFAAVPVLVFIGLVAALSHLGHRAVPILLTHAPDAAQSGFVGTLVSWTASIVVLLVAVFIAAALSPIASAPALDKLVELTERALGAEPAEGPGFLGEFLIGLKAQALVMAVATPLFFGLWLLTILVPPAAVATLPLKYALLALTIAWNLFDYPLTRRGLGMRARLGFIRRSFGAFLGFGTGIAVLLAVPCIGLLVLPASVAGASRLVVAIEGSVPPARSRDLA